MEPFSFDRVEPKKNDGADLFEERSEQATRSKPGEKRDEVNGKKGDSQMEPKKPKKLVFKTTKKMEQLKKIRKEQEEKFKAHVRIKEEREKQRRAKHQVGLEMRANEKAAVEIFRKKKMLQKVEPNAKKIEKLTKEKKVLAKKGEKEYWKNLQQINEKVRK